MFLALDIGNTEITVGLFSVEDKKTLPNPLRVWRMSTRKKQTSDEYAVMLMNIFFYSDFDAKKIDSIAAASVVPSLNSVFEELFKKYFNREIFFISYKKCGKLVFLPENSKETGADRIANIVAAYSFYSGNCIVIDLGTATTFDCINCNGEYLGGAIVLGPSIFAQALNLKTSQLPYVALKKPLKAIGSNTVECIQSGLYFGYIGLVKEIIAKMKKEMKVKHVIATGGLADLVANETKEIEVILPNLTLEGIRIIWENSDKGGKN